MARVTPSYDAVIERYRNDDLAGAVAGLQELVAEDPHHTPAHYHLGLALHRLGRTAEAIAHYCDLLERFPDYLDAWINLGDLYGKAEKPDLAIAAWQRALALDADSVLILNNLAITQANCGRGTEAIGYFRQAAAMAPDRHDIWFGLGNALLGKGLHAQAILIYEQARRIDSRHAQTHNNLAVALGQAGHEDASIAALRQALESDPDLPDGLNNLALALHKRYQSEEAVALLRHCTLRHPSYALGWSNLGMVLQGTGMLHDAVAATDQALKLQPDVAGWIWNQSLAFLTLGDFKRGWQGFETRYAPERGDSNFTDPQLPFPMWQGEPLAGKRLLLVKEQGFGDQIQCLRFARDLAALGAQVDIWVHTALAGLFASASGIRQVWTERPDALFDAWAYVMSLPARLGLDEAHIRASATPYLFAHAKKTNSVGHQKAAFASGRCTVALNWSGNPSHPNDRNRSLSVESMAPWFEMDEIAWISVQKDRGQQACEWVERQKLIALGDSIQDFTDTAAILANVDRLITVDSAVAHLAGAMGVPTWLLLPANADYRWMRGRTDTPWYPTVRLWQQTVLGEWSGVIREIASCLRLELHRKEWPCETAPCNTTPTMPH